MLLCLTVGWGAFALFWSLQGSDSTKVKLFLILAGTVVLPSPLLAVVVVFYSPDFYNATKHLFLTPFLMSHCVYSFFLLAKGKWFSFPVVVLLSGLLFFAHASEGSARQLLYLAWLFGLIWTYQVLHK